MNAFKWLKKRDLNLSMVMNIDPDKFCCICDHTVISRDLEQMVLQTLDEDNSGDYIGFFIEDNKVANSAPPGERVVTMAICNIEGVNKDGSVVLELLCANSKKRIKHATLFLLSHIISQSAVFGFKTIRLRIATNRSDGKPNKRALEFYTKLGFVYDEGIKHYVVQVADFLQPTVLTTSTSSSPRKSSPTQNPRRNPLSIINL